MDSMPTFYWFSYGALWLLVLLHTLVLLEVVRRLARVGPSQGEPMNDDLLRTGTAAPAFTSQDIRSGEQITSTSLIGQAMSLVFVGPRCSGCTALARDLSDPVKRTREPLAMICIGAESDCAEFSGRYSFDFPLLLDESGQIAQEYKVHTTPTVIQIDDNWNVVRYGTPQHLAG